MQGRLCSFSTPMKANFSQPRSSSALTSNSLLAAVLYSGEMQLLMEVMLAEEEVLAQIAWDICRGFLNIKAVTTMWILCKMWEHHLQTLGLGGGDAHCQQALILFTCWPGVPLAIRTVVQCAHRMPLPASRSERRWRISLVHTAPLCTGLCHSGVLKGTVENLGEYYF